MMIAALITIWTVIQFVGLFVCIPLYGWLIYDRLRHGDTVRNPRAALSPEVRRRLTEKAAADLVGCRQTNNSGHSGRFADPRQMSRRRSAR